MNGFEEKLSAHHEQVQQPNKLVFGSTQHSGTAYTFYTSLALNYKSVEQNLKVFDVEEKNEGLFLTDKRMINLFVCVSPECMM